MARSRVAGEIRLEALDDVVRVVVGHLVMTADVERVLVESGGNRVLRIEVAEHAAVDGLVDERQKRTSSPSAHP